MRPSATMSMSEWVRSSGRTPAFLWLGVVGLRLTPWRLYDTYASPERQLELAMRIDETLPDGLRSRNRPRLALLRSARRRVRRTAAGLPCLCKRESIGRGEARCLRVPDPEREPRMIADLRALKLLCEWSAKPVYVSLEGPFTLANDLGGMGPTMRSLVKDPGLVDELMLFSTSVVKRYADAVAATGVDLIIISEPQAANISSEEFERFVMPACRYIFDGIDCWKGMHICGRVDHLVEQMLACGARMPEPREGDGLPGACGVSAGGDRAPGQSRADGLPPQHAVADTRGDTAPALRDAGAPGLHHRAGVRPAARYAGRQRAGFSRDGSRLERTVCPRGRVLDGAQHQRDRRRGRPSSGLGADRFKEAKEAGTKIVGLYCGYIPFELVRAVGAVPVSLCGDVADSIPAAELELPRNFCPLIKSSYGLAITDTCPFFHFSDALIGETTCDGKKKVFELLGRLRPVHVMQLPYDKSAPHAYENWRREIERVAELSPGPHGRRADRREALGGDSYRERSAQDAPANSAHLREAEARSDVDTDALRAIADRLRR